MAIEDFEWEGEVELTQPTHADAGNGVVRRESWLARLRQSVWLEPVLRLGGMAALLAVLATIGALASMYVKPGMKLPEGPHALSDALGTSWLKPTPSAQASPRPSANVAELPALVVSAAASSEAPPEATPVAPDTGVTADGRVILNRASADELTKLPGVGRKRADAIVALRTKLKRFRQVTDLLRVKGIGPRGLKRMLPHLVLDAP
jgi:competence protein ComEA